MSRPACAPGDLLAPWPGGDEPARRPTLATRFHFAPTRALARQSARAKDVAADTIHVTGNTVIDALLATVRASERCRTVAAAPVDARFAYLDPIAPLVLVTGHRRENFGEGFESICGALRDIVDARRRRRSSIPCTSIPNVAEPVERMLGGHPRIHLIEPLDYLPFVYLMERSHLILTDSGGVQEEAPSLGKPVLVMRDTTERPEAVEAGTVVLVGTDREARLSSEASRLLNDDGRTTRAWRTHITLMATARPRPHSRSSMRGT